MLSQKIMVTEKFREAILVYLNENRMSIGKLGRDLSLNTDTLRKFIAGETQNITLKNFETISDYIGFEYTFGSK